MIVDTTVSNFIGWVVGEHVIHRLCIYFNLYTETKSKNPLFRNVKTLASLGGSLGVSFAILGVSSTDLKVVISIYSASASFIVGLSAFVFRGYQQSLPVIPGDQHSIDAQVGTEGWSKYTKLAFIFGTSIGQSIGGYVSYVAGCDGVTSWANITFYGAIAATTSFFSALILVPVVNYLTRDNHEKARGILVTNNKDIFNNSYIRSGMTLGMALGTILGGLLGPVIIVGLNTSVGIAVGAGVFSIISGITLGVYGYQLSLYLQEHWGVPVDTDNSWSYASRNTAYVFSFIGSALACVLCPGAGLLQSVTIGSAIASVVGWFAGFGVIWKARQLESDEEKTKTALPWTQRISAGANRGSTIGAFAGLMLVFCFGELSCLMGWILLASALGGISGGVKDGIAESVAKSLIWKSLFGDRNTLVNVVETGNESSALLAHSIMGSGALAPVGDGHLMIQAEGTDSISTNIGFSLGNFSNRNLLFSSINKRTKRDTPAFLESLSIEL